MPDARRPLATLLTAAALAACSPWRADARTWAPEQPEISRELAAHARPLDIAYLWDLTRDADIIAVGEATHGTREFRLLWNEMVARAADDARPLVVALELPFDLGLRLDAWASDAWYPADPGIAARPLDDDRVLGKNWLHAVAETRALFTWIREHNRRGRSRRIRIVGVDVCMSSSCGVPEIGAYLRAVDPGYPTRLLLAPFRGLDLERAANPELVARARAGLVALGRRLALRRDRHVAERGAEAHAVALRMIWLAGRRLDLAVVHGENPVSGERDLAMADTVDWVRDAFGDDIRVLLFAHNAHVGRELGRLPNGRRELGPVLGQKLAARHGDAYAVVATAFDAGTFLAYGTRSTVGAESPRVTRLRAFPVAPAPAGTLEAVLRSASSYVLDVRATARGDDPLARYLRAEHWSRLYTYAWKPIFDLIPVAWHGVTPAADYDVLCYFPRTSATTTP